MSTHFPRKDIHKVTWVSPSGQVGNQIDYVLIDHIQNDLVIYKMYVVQGKQSVAETTVSYLSTDTKE